VDEKQEMTMTSVGIHKSHFLLRWSLAVGLVCAALTAAHGEGTIVLHDVTKETNIAFKHTDGSCGKHYIMETVSAGLALFDNDGDRDLFIACGRSYQSHYGMRLHFGLGQHKKLDRIEVRWIGGGVDVFNDVAVDQCLTLTEGGSKVESR
jgi:hypothetical protein